MFTNNISMISLPKDQWRELESSYKFLWFWLGVTISGMIFASIWQWAYNVHAKSLMDAPFVLQAMMVGGAISFLVSLINAFIVLPVLLDIRKYIWPKVQRCFSWKRV